MPAPSTPRSPRLISAKHAAEELGIPYSSLRDAVFRGELPVVKFGANPRFSRWFFERADLDRFVEAHKERCA